MFQIPFNGFLKAPKQASQKRVRHSFLSNSRITFKTKSMENKERFTHRNEDLNKDKLENTNLNPLDDDSMEGRDQPVDLDGDGMIGNTGGFYGGTSYVGSNYGADWNANNTQHEGNYGAAGQQDSTDMTENNHIKRASNEEANRLERGQ